VNSKVAAVCTLLVWLTVVSTAMPQRTVKPQAPSEQKPQAQAAPQSAHTTYQRQGTWYEFMLKQFNPDNLDYGSWIEQQRRDFIDARARNPYFLYGLSATIALMLMTVVCAKLGIDHRREMWITAEMMADIYNQDAYSRRVAQEAIEKYNTHIERCNRAIEAAEHGEAVSGAEAEVEQLRSELIRVAGERDTAARERDVAREDLQKKSEILAEMSVRLEALASKSGTTSSSGQPADLRTADPKLVTHINNLQEQLYAERNNNRRLKGA
jgi:hypothetical protein